MSARVKQVEMAAGPRDCVEAPCPVAAEAQAFACTTPEGVPPDLAASSRDDQPRLRTADRQQLISPMIIDELLEADHPARAVWSFALGLDLTQLYDRIQARGSDPGRPAIDPRILVALWLYATLQGVNSARALAELCVRHDVYFWLAGGIAVNAHTLADFRVQGVDFLERLLEHSVTVLREQDLVDLRRVAQDGMRVRASAGAASFRRRATLAKALHDAQAEVARLQQEAESSPDPTDQQETATKPQEAKGPSAQQRGAARRHARQRVERVEQALKRLAELESKEQAEKQEKAEEGKDKAKKKEARASTTDAQATIMKMAEGGYRPAYNVQFSTDCGSQVIVGVDVVMVGNDQGQLPPMLEQIEERFEKRPDEALVDGGFVRLEDIEKLQGGEKKCTVYAPVPKPKKEGVDRHQTKRSDGPETASWRVRMGTDEAKEIYKERGATAECVNAQTRNRGLVQFVVRGLHKVRAIAMWFAGAHNMARGFALQPQPQPTG